MGLLILSEHRQKLLINRRQWNRRGLYRVCLGRVRRWKKRWSQWRSTRGSDTWKSTLLFLAITLKMA